MEKTINFNGNNKDFIIYKEKKYYYESYSGRIKWDFEIVKLLSDENYYNEIVESLGFNRFEIIYVYENMYKFLYIPLSKELIEYHTTKEEYKNNDEIELSNINLNNNVDSFYEFSTEVEIDNFRTAFQRSFAFKDMIYIETSENEKLKSHMNHFLGEPQNIPELESEKYGSGKKHFYYIVPKSRINKIIGIKKNRNTSTFGQYDGEQFTGEVEEIILDLNNFDKNIYKTFIEHGMLKIEGLE